QSTSSRRFAAAHVGHPEGQRSCAAYPADCAFTVIYGEDSCPWTLSPWLEEVFSAASLDEDGFLFDEQDVIQLMKTQQRRQTSRIKRNTHQMETIVSTEDLLMFLEAEQGEFTAFLQSEFCDIFDPEHPGIEVWNGPNDEGRSYTTATPLTSKIGLRDVLDTVRQFAFYKTKPLQPGQQCRMVQLIRSTLGDWLLDPGSASESDVQLLSDPRLLTPSRLRRRILVKCKKLRLRQKVALRLAANGRWPPCSKAQSPSLRQRERTMWDIQRDRSPKGFKKAGNQSSPVPAQQQQQQQPHAAASAAAQCGRRIKLSQELSDLAALAPSECRLGAGGSRRQPDHQQQHQLLHQQVWSISESAAFRLAQSDDGRRLVGTAGAAWCRCSPTPSGWTPATTTLRTCGAAAVSWSASTHQTPGLMTDLNPRQFSKNGSCGFVLKPGAIARLSPSSPSAAEAARTWRPHSLHSFASSAARSCRSHAAPLLRATSPTPALLWKCSALPADCSEERTKTVHGNGYNPFRVSLPELALLRLVVLDDDAIGDDFIGQFTIFVRLHPDW
uniref:PI-PLC Y-box domain-containing protein n=1 Tax=Macrostomum lignano TaxID=282301 RepID=A0A1I8FGN8_9PLAT